MARTIHELLQNNQFKYNSKLSPTFNYNTFQQAISFVHGVEFLKTSNFSNKPILFLLKVPVLSINLADAEKTLKSFNEKLLEQLQEFIDQSRNQFDIFMHYYELYRAVLVQQEEYKDSKEEFFASASAIQFNISDIKEHKLPVIRTYYKGLFHDQFRDASQPIEFEKIGTEGIRHLEKLYLLKRRYNMRLIKELTGLRKRLFKENTFTNQYKYTGDVADILEIALSLYFSGKMIRLDGRETTAAQFSKDLALFLGRTFSTVQANKSTIDKRITQKDSFLLRSIKSLSSR